MAIKGVKFYKTCDIDHSKENTEDVIQLSNQIKTTKDNQNIPTKFKDFSDFIKYVEKNFNTFTNIGHNKLYVEYEIVNNKGESEKYKGEINKTGLLNGIGFCEYANGNKYIGYWKNGKSINGKLTIYKNKNNKNDIDEKNITLNQSDITKEPPYLYMTLLPYYPKAIFWNKGCFCSCADFNEEIEIK